MIKDLHKGLRYYCKTHFMWVYHRMKERVFSKSHWAVFKEGYFLPLAPLQVLHHIWVISWCFRYTLNDFKKRTSSVLSGVVCATKSAWFNSFVFGVVANVCKFLSRFKLIHFLPWNLEVEWLLSLFLLSDYFLTTFL